MRLSATPKRKIPVVANPASQDLYGPCVKGTVVIEHAEQIFISGFAGVSKLLDKVRVVGFVCLIRDYAEEAAVDEYRYFELCHPKIVKPPFGGVYCSPTSVADSDYDAPYPA